MPEKFVIIFVAWLMLTWNRLYRDAELYQAAVRLYTKPLFDWRKALVSSTDGQTLYDFARRGLTNLAVLHRELAARRFRFRPGLALRRNFNGRERTLYVYPWEERLVGLLLYRLLNRALDSEYSSSSYAYRRRGYGVDRCQREITRTLHQANGPRYVLKRDITDFFGSIDHEILEGKLAELILPGDYLLELLADALRFPYLDEDGREVRAKRGVPFGTAVACAFANIYLQQLDRRLESLAGVRFFRYADDLLVLAQDRRALNAAAHVFDDEMQQLRLASKPTHEQHFYLPPACHWRLTSANNQTSQPSKRRSKACERKSEERSSGAHWRDASGTRSSANLGDLPIQHRFRHLGLEFRADGSVGLARDKFRKICNLFRYALRRKARKFRRLKDPEKRARLAVRTLNAAVEQGVRNVAIIDYYLRHVTDEDQLRRLDRWLAEEVLATAFGGHRKGHFRRLPFKRLRQWGLVSLVHRRRLIRHRQIESPFFRWRRAQTQRGYGGPAARRRPRASAFSQSPEAAADNAS